MMRAVKEVIRLDKVNKLQKEEIERLHHANANLILHHGNIIQEKTNVKLWVSFVLVLNFV
jgi:hypothetical protein